MLKFDELAKANGTVTFGNVEYALAQDAFISNVGTDGECAYFAAAITRETEAEAIENNEASHRVQWDIQNPDCDDESDACNWAEPTDVKFLWGGLMSSETKRGGARQGAGRKAEDGAAGLVLYPVKLPPELKAWCQEIGAAEVRKILANAKQASQ